LREKYKGEFEERLKSVKEVTAAEGDIVYSLMRFIRSGAGGGEGAMDAANILKPALARGELRAIGATTLMNTKYFEKTKHSKDVSKNNYRRTRYRKCNFNPAWYQRKI
jgi:ATP-dependent Clp protease ATP-binding subunit ClpA